MTQSRTQSPESAVDLREGGQWTPLQRMKNDALFAVASIALAIARRVPRAWLGRIGLAAAWLARVAWPSARRLAEANVRCAMPDADARAIVRRTYRTLGVHLGDALALLHDDAPLEALPFPAEARRVFDEAIAEGHGVVFASAHLGPWERVAATLVAEGVPLSAITREPYDPRFRSVYDRLRGGRGVRAIPRGERGAAARMLRVLRRGEVLGIPMDLASRVPSVEVPFLGRPAPTARGPARLALRTGAAVVVATVAPGADGALVITASRIATSEADTEHTLTHRINDELSTRIRALPEAWVWMHDRWRGAEWVASPPRARL